MPPICHPAPDTGSMSPYPVTPHLMRGPSPLMAWIPDLRPG